MGLLSLLHGKKERKSLGVCIPEHARIAIEEKVREAEDERKKLEEEEKNRDPVFSDSVTRFMVEGIYVVEKTTMVKGRALNGVVKCGAKVQPSYAETKVKEIISGSKKLTKLGRGETGALFLTKMSSGIRIGDILEFA